MSRVTVAATQLRCSKNVGDNLDQAEGLVRRAASLGAKVILLPELFAGRYFCIEENPAKFALASPASESALVERFSQLARELEVVLPLSFFERSNQAFFNSVVVIDADGTNLGIYRKSHIPDGPGYEEKFYFSPGDTGFRVWKTRFATLGIGICWDQWFPECARIMALKGAEILLYPTAIGSEPSDPTLDTTGQWRRVMQGHSAANLMPVVASNRVGEEEGRDCSVTFYGHSFVTDHTGDIVSSLELQAPEVALAEFDLDEIAKARSSFGLFRDRRPDLYGPLLSLDGG